jgi:hypothetical protein
MGSFLEPRPRDGSPGTAGGALKNGLVGSALSGTGASALGQIVKDQLLSYR